MISDEIKISNFSGENFSRILKLTQTTYPGHEIADERYLFWEYINNPDGQAIMNIAESSGKAIAQYAVIPRSFNFKGRIFKGSVSVNTLTHPEFRGNNLFPKLAAATFEQCKEKKILFTIGFPNPQSLPVIQKKEIFSVVGSLSVLFRPLNPFFSFIRVLSKKKEKRGGEIPLMALTFKNSTVDEFNITTSSASYNVLLNLFNKKNQISSHRNADFFKWRYSDIPRRTYFSLKHGEENTDAIIVFRAKYIYGIRCLIIVDIIAVDQRSVKILLKEIVRIAKVNHLDLILSAIPKHSEEYSSFKESGFYSVPDVFLPQKLAFIVKKHHECPEDVLDFENWFLTFGDYDIF